MPVEEHEVHEKVKVDDSFRYGCHSRPDYNTGYFAPERRYKPDGTFYVVQTCIPFSNSPDCRSFALWDIDPACAGCTTKKDFEYRDRMMALR